MGIKSDMKIRPVRAAACSTCFPACSYAPLAGSDAPVMWLLGQKCGYRAAVGLQHVRVSWSQAGLSRSYHCLYDEMPSEIISVQGMHVLGHEWTAMYVINLYVSWRRWLVGSRTAWTPPDVASGTIYQLLSGPGRHLEF